MGITSPYALLKGGAQFGSGPEAPKDESKCPVQRICKTVLRLALFRSAQPILQLENLQTEQANMEAVVAAGGATRVYGCSSCRPYPGFEDLSR